MMNAPTPVGKFDRQKYIGSSDAAAILRVSKWKTPFQLYQEKIGEFVEEITPAKQKILDRGHRNASGFKVSFAAAVAFEV